MHDSGEREQFDKGAVRDTAAGKSRPDLISPLFKLRVGEHLGKGAEKYAEYNWAKGMPISRCVASLERHLAQYQMGDETEDHLAAIGCNIMFIIHYEEAVKLGMLPEEINDMPKYGRTYERVDEIQDGSSVAESEQRDGCDKNSEASRLLAKQG